MNVRCAIGSDAPASIRNKCTPREGKIQVPNHLKDSSRDGKALGHGKDYKYPHDFPGHHVEQQYLPDRLRGHRFYEPSDQGYEQEIAARLAQWRRDTQREENAE